MITTKRLLKSLEWMITDMSHGFDASGMGGGYSEELTEAILLVKELRENGESAVLSQSTIGEMRMLAKVFVENALLHKGGQELIALFAEDGIDLTDQI